MHRYSTLGVTVTLGKYFTTTFFVVPSLILTMLRITINDFDLSLIYTKNRVHTYCAVYQLFARECEPYFLANFSIR
jgi:hypothetical protein